MKMMNPPHPGRYIAEAMEELGIGIRELARALDVSPSTIQRVVVGKSIVTPEMAIRLAKVMGSTPAMWLRLQAVNSLSKAEQEIDVSSLPQLFKNELNSPLLTHS